MPKSKTTCVQAKLIDNHTCDDTLATKYGNTKINKRHDETTKTKHLAATIYNKIPCITPPIDSRPPALYVYTTSVLPTKTKYWQKVLFTRESDPRSYEATKAVAMKAQRKFWSFNGIWTHHLRDTGVMLYQLTARIISLIFSIRSAYIWPTRWPICKSKVFTFTFHFYLVLIPPENRL